ncbi:maintenance of morphology protein [Anaeramoeba flamelloides]|uniref:Maintenance of morphology protein n=1 Tax=Anaeramoeba flamelloides TaxID=1746091 RepID=A0ABQ8XCN6_9EUKA|nr:maintenance of morphology protein [Anaeramoeba flamelloides]
MLILLSGFATGFFKGCLLFFILITGFFLYLIFKLDQYSEGKIKRLRQKKQTISKNKNEKENKKQNENENEKEKENEKEQETEIGWESDSDSDSDWSKEEFASPSENILERDFPFLGQEFKFGETKESCEWLNSLVSRIGSEVLSTEFLRNFEQLLNTAIGTQEIPDILSGIKVHDLRIGKSVPQISSVSLCPNFTTNIRKKILDSYDLELNLSFGKDKKSSIFSFLTFSTSTSFVLNWPVPNFASLPITIRFSLSYFDLHLHIKIPNKLRPTLSVSLRKDSELEFEILPQIGEENKFTQLELVSKLINNTIFLAIAELIQEPNQIEIPLDLTNTEEEIEKLIMNIQKKKEIEKKNPEKRLTKKTNFTKMALSKIKQTTNFTNNALKRKKILENRIGQNFLSKIHKK